MWLARTKQDLIIEVWEKLDCESVGAREIVAIEVVVREVYGAGAVENPMIIARQLADEGAVLRYPEVMNLFVKRSQPGTHAPMFRNIPKTADLRQALNTIRRLENLRRKFLTDGDKDGLRLVRDTGIECKSHNLAISNDQKAHPAVRVLNAEIAEWFTIWLQSPELFENWVVVRKRSKEFIAKYESERINDAGMSDDED